ncbi:MAG: hypothetical protein ACI8QC_003621 [Planctomycetota bacterium]|jgi:hypothetical protein
MGVRVRNKLPLLDDYELGSRSQPETPPMNLRPLALALVTLGLPFTFQDPTPDTPTPAVATLGKTAPGLRLNDQSGKAIALDFAERWTVLAFFPKAATPG